MKRIISLLLVVLLCAALAAPVCADTYEGNDSLLLLDEANLLTETEKSALRRELAQVSKQYGAQVAIGTVDSLEGGDIDGFINYLYDTFGYGYGSDAAGVLLLVCMDMREFRILSNGFAADAITMGAIDSITDAITPDLASGDYEAAFAVYVKECSYYLNGYINGYPFQGGKKLLISLVIGLVCGLVVALILKGQLRSVRRQNQANVYVKPGSMHLTQSGDYFMYRNVTRTPRQQNSASSGSSRNVGGGRF